MCRIKHIIKTQIGSLAALAAVLWPACALAQSSGRIFRPLDEPFDTSSWNGDARNAPSRNAVRDAVFDIYNNTADRTLSNLNGPTEVSQSLTPADDAALDLGSGTLRWRDLYGNTLRTGTTAADTLLLQARDVDGSSWTTFGTLTAGNTPSYTLSGATITGGTINNTAIGGTTPAAGAFTTVSVGVGNWGAVVPNTLAVKADGDLAIYGAYDDVNNYERLRFYQGAGNLFYITSEAAGSYTAQNLSVSGPGVQVISTSSHLSMQSAGAILFASGGSTFRWAVDNNFYVGVGHFVPGADNTYDIGGASWRPRTLYAGTSVDTPKLVMRESSADPANPAEGSMVLWQSDGTGFGDDGDVVIKVTAGGVTKTVTLVDFSAATDEEP